MKEWRRVVWLLAGTAFVPPSCIDLDPPKVASVQSPLYCYTTLDQPECFTQPQPGQEFRFVGAQVPIHVHSIWDPPPPSVP
jgi:hypothetical protein